MFGQEFDSPHLHMMSSPPGRYSRAFFSAYFPKIRYLLSFIHYEIQNLAFL